MLHSKTPNVRLAAIGTAIPPYRADQLQVEEFFLQNFATKLKRRSLQVLQQFLAHPAIRERRFAIDQPDSLLKEDPDKRIERFTRWALELSVRAAQEAMASAGVAPREVSALVVNTCTGYLCPGLSSYLLEKLELPRNIRTYDLVGGGCGGAIPNLQAAQEYLRAVGKGAALCIAVEICSATFQTADDLGLLLSNALFADGAAAVVLWARPQGVELVASSNRHQPEDRESLRYVYRNGQLYNQLSRALPSLVNRAVAQAVEDVLAPRNLTPADVAHWALHCGGDRVLTAVARALDLPVEKLAPTRETLRRYGNMSSPSVLFTLKDILNNGIHPGDWCMTVSFGAGLSAHSLLLRAY
jgi:predicted naringenin-chalcone synthase